MIENNKPISALIKGRIAGTAEVRDKNGNIKGSFSFGGDGDKATYDEMRKSTNLGDDNGSNTDHSGP